MEEKTQDTILNLISELETDMLRLEGQEAKPDSEQDIFFTTLNRIIKRYNFITNNLDSIENLEKYIKNHNTPDQVNNRIDYFFNSKMHQLQSIAEETNNLNIIEGSRHEIFLNLIKENIIDASRVFAELPEPINIGIIKNILKIFPKYVKSEKKEQAFFKEATQALHHEYRASTGQINNQWRALTGNNLDPNSPLPPLSELLSYRAPIPLEPVWSRQKNTLESKLMNSSESEQNNCCAEETNNSDTELNEINNNQGETFSLTAEDDGDNQSSSSEGIESTEQGVDQTCIQCEPREIIEKSGGLFLDSRTLEDEKKYTFPQDLEVGEDIFYDYTVLIPVDNKYAPCSYVAQPAALDLQALSLLAMRGLSIIESLNQMGLSQVLGFQIYNGTQESVANVIREYLSQITLPIIADQADEIFTEHKRTARKLAGAIRTAARSQLFYFNPNIGNPNELLTQLEAALSEFPDFSFDNHLLPNTSGSDSETSTLTFPAPVNRSVPDADRKYILPDDSQPGTTAIGGTSDTTIRALPAYSYYTNAKVNQINSYLQYLGRTFHDSLRYVISSAEAIVGSVGPLSQGYTQFRSDFERLATGIVNDAAQALSTILDEIADMIKLPFYSNSPGSKRLAIQCIFRQYWFPEGYVKGKLVGYKTLIPGETQTVKRRTFVRTQTETSTIQEFSAARQNEYSATQRETGEVVRETSSSFNFTSNASGDFDILIWSGELDLGFESDFSETSKAVHNSLAETIMKGSVKYNDRREIKIRELLETENVQEVTTELQNPNQEITANYFYFKLLRQYCVTSQLYDIRPVLVRTREIPTIAEVDDHFISKYIHILVNVLPAQLSADAQETVNEIELLAKALIRRKSERDQIAASLEVMLNDPTPSEDPQVISQEREKIRSLEQRLTDAQTALDDADEIYTRARMRMNRVVSHVRENLCYYMQFIWQQSPRVDHDKVLRNENYCFQSLPAVTQGLNRVGFIGNDEIFEYTGKSAALFHAILSTLTPGSETLQDPEKSQIEKRLEEYLSDRYCEENCENLSDKIKNFGFITDPINVDEAFRSRRIQVAQDALVAEALPGKIPLLEGNQMAHRMLNIQRTCLENKHLSERVRTRAWQNNSGKDSYVVKRYEGSAPPQLETSEE